MNSRVLAGLLRRGASGSATAGGADASPLRPLGLIDSSAQVPSSLRQRGFTLLEIVVVVLIMGVMVTFASLSIGNRVNEDKLETEAKRTEAVLRLASEEAEAKGIEIGLRFTDGGYRLLTLDSSRHWQDYELSGPLRRRAFQSPFALTLQVEGKPVTLPPELTPEQEAALAESVAVKSDRDNAAQQLTPQLLLLSSGEITPFTLQLSAPGIAAYYQLESDAFGRIQLQRKPRTATAGTR